MSYPLCDKYGFDETQRANYLSLMGLTSECHEFIDIIHQSIIQNHAEPIVNEFYDQLLSFPDIKKFINSHTTVEKLKVTQLLYIKSYGLNFDQADYFEQRLRIGLVHAQIKLPLSFYKASFRILDEIFFEYITDMINLEDKPSLAFFKVLSRISTLDMSLAIETYHNVKVQDMSSSIEALRDERQSLSSIIDHDELTQVASRSRILEYLNDVLQQSLIHNKTFCVAMIDIDHFKDVNDNYGHLVGDQILKGIAARMQSSLRENNMLGRYGGEEFALIFPDANIDIARKISDRLCKHVAKEPFQVNGLSITVTISVGVTDFHKDDKDEDLIGRADHALYKAKNNGRNQVVVEYYNK